MVPMLQCGLLRSNFALAMIHLVTPRLCTAPNRRLVTAENGPVQV
jgi:hypothetical protein